jgi:hypothetical protein
MLAVNRAVELLAPAWFADALFKGWRCWLWLLVPNFYGLYVLVFEKPVFFNGLYFAWFYNPFLGYVSTDVDPKSVQTFQTYRALSQ